jgi:glycosyltransferase involved in cell wall biosynthesis
MTPGPLFTIAIPVYNRPDTVRRAIGSCVKQTYPDFSVVVVDDGSSDGTVAAIGECADSRLTVIRHDENRGVCAARNTAARAADGEWIVFLDSDDELLPEALATMAAHIESVDKSVSRLGFSYVRADGRLSPAIIPPGQIDYIGYLRWSDHSPLSDFVICVRRETFAVVQYPVTRVYERIYHLEFARSFQTRLFRQVVARVHEDAPNRAANLGLRGYFQRQQREAHACLDNIDEILCRHGEALATHAPRVYRHLVRRRAETLLFAGQRLAAFRGLLSYIAEHPVSADGWVTFAASVAGARALASMQLMSARLRS